MSNCSVATCKNYSKITRGTDIKYFRFPSNKHLAKQWIAACGRKGPINLKNARICSLHFVNSCFEVPLQQKMLGYTPINSRHLKPDAVPTLNIHEFPAEIQKRDNEERNMRSSKRRQRDEVAGMLKATKAASVKLELTDIESFPEQPPKNLDLDHDIGVQLMDVESRLQSEPRAEKNEKEIIELGNKIKILEEENNKLRIKLKKAEWSIAIYEDILVRLPNGPDKKTDEPR